MSIRKRLINIARAELKDAARKVKSSAEGLLGGGSDVGEDEADRPREEETVRSQNSRGRVSVVAERETAEIRRYYANLELPIGASSMEVKAAYRRLMRRYHPDLHQADGEKAEVATKLAQELRVAYEGLLKHLERQG